MDAFATSIPEKLTALWDFGAVADTQRKFQALLDEALVLLGGEQEDGTHDAALVIGRKHPQVLEVLTQIARTQGLQCDFDAAHATLDRVQLALTTTGSPHGAAVAGSLDRQALVATPTRVYVRYLLERGRVYNSSKQPTVALPLFVHAWEMAQCCDEDDLEVDAAHMVAIAEPTNEQQTTWNLRALAKAESSCDAKTRQWIGSLSNNLGWTYHGAGKLDAALEMFEKALAYRTQMGDAKTIAIAKWCTARCLRSLGRVDESLAIQQALVGENEKLGTPDGYNFEELGELQLLMGDSAQARGHFQRAADLLAADAWFAENEKDRLVRLQCLARGETP